MDALCRCIFFFLLLGYSLAKYRAILLKRTSALKIHSGRTKKTWRKIVDDNQNRLCQIVCDTKINMFKLKFHIFKST